jgi:hypothetical protein
LVDTNIIRLMYESKYFLHCIYIVLVLD